MGLNDVCVIVISCHYVIAANMMMRHGSTFRKREARLMEICDWEGMSDDKWTAILKVLILVAL